MKLLSIIALFIFTSTVYAQTISPYQLSSDWAFGVGGRMVFAGQYPSSANGVTSTMGTNTSVSIEASSSIVYRDKVRALYSNTMQTYNNNPLTGGTWLNFIYNQTANNICAGSSTGGGVFFPDPTANNSFYYVSGNDLTGGSCQNQGNNRVRYSGYPLATQDVGHGLVNVDIDANVGENLTVGADRSGGYWLATHDKSNANIFKLWHYTSAGITGPVTFDMTQNFTASAISQSYIKFSPCMDKIAFTGANWVVVYEFDNVTGIIGTPVWENNVGVASGVGLEFSTDGDRIYWSGNNTTINWHDITSNTNGGLSDRSWSMQMGLDGNIYTSPGSSTSLGRIDNSNSAPAVTAVPITGGGNVYRGLTNLAWLSPYRPDVTSVLPNASVSCSTYDFNFNFKNYYNTDISIKTTEAVIDFGDGVTVNNPVFPITHVFPTVGTFNVKYSFKDLYCDKLWEAYDTITVSCPLGIMPYPIYVNTDPKCDKFAIYPNPSGSGYFNIVTCEAYKLEVYTVDGALLLTTTEKDFTLNTSGTYIGKFYFEDRILLFKFVKN